MIYMIYAANWVDLIEVLLGANMIPKTQEDGIGVLCDDSYLSDSVGPSE